jgi:hypothetical protein
MLLTERSASTISGSIRLREFRAFLIHRGGMFARNLKKARTAEPELDEKSLASLAIAARLLQGFHTHQRFHEITSATLSSSAAISSLNSVDVVSSTSIYLWFSVEIRV